MINDNYVTFFVYFIENVSIIGSDDVTTCIILVLRHTGVYIDLYKYNARNRYLRIVLKPK